jgi:hypothetical protein
MMSWRQKLEEIVGICISSLESPPESSLHLIRRLTTRLGNIAKLLINPCTFIK